MRRSALAALMAIGCAVSGPAPAADRQTPPGASGVEAPRDCGIDGFALPGSAGCVRLSGTVAVTTTLRTGGNAAQVPARTPRLFTTHAGARLAADVRIPTDLGAFRVYTAVRITDPGGLGRAGHPR